MMEREVRPELLDSMDPTDPEAVRSRRDLRRLNFLMGNDRWIADRVRRHRSAAAKGVVELGAGEGRLAERLAKWGPVTAVDLAPRPHGLAGAVDWLRQDAVGSVDLAGGVLLANLFLHHFEGAELRAIGRIAARFEVLVFVEPLRTAASLALGRTMLPFVGDVTRHDMLVSIRAGFVPGELAGLLGLEPGAWWVEERSSWRGGLRVLASRA